MTSEDLEDEFESHGTRRGGILLLRAPEAIVLVQRAREARLSIVGVDGFHLSPTSTQPDLNHILDLSRASSGTDPWAAAEVFLERRADSDMYFEVVLGDQQADS